MKRLILLAIGLLLVAGSVFAQQDSTYAGLFTDVGRTTWTVTHAASYTPFTLYIYWLPSAVGLQCAEFKISVPADVVMGTTTANPDIAVQIGTVTSGASLCFLDCQPGGVWVWSHHVACFLTNADVGIIEIVPDPTAITPVLQISSCELGNPFYHVRKFTNICLNSTCGTATRPTTWGAIKSLF